MRLPGPDGHEPQIGVRTGLYVDTARQVQRDATDVAIGAAHDLHLGGGSSAACEAEGDEPDTPGEPLEGPQRRDGDDPRRLGQAKARQVAVRNGGRYDGQGQQEMQDEERLVARGTDGVEGQDQDQGEAEPAHEARGDEPVVANLPPNAGPPIVGYVDDGPCSPVEEGLEDDDASWGTNVESASCSFLST